MKKITKFLIILLIILASVFTESTVRAEEKIKIGVSTALTGIGTTWGTDVKNVVLFANKELVEDKYEIVIEDDQCSGKEAVSVAHKFVDILNIKYVFGNCSATVLSAIPVYKKAGVVVLAPIATSPNISLLGGVFRTAPSDAATAQILFDFIASRHKRVGILTEQSDYSQNLEDAFIKSNIAHKLEIIKESYLSTDSDFKSVLLKFQKGKIDSLFINSSSEASFTLILKQIREANYNFSLYAVYFPSSTTFLESAGKLGNGIVFADFPSVESTLTENGAKLYQKFISEHGKMKAWNIVFTTTMEAFRALDQAIQSGDDVKEYLLNHEFSGVSGKYRFDKNGDIVGLKNVLRQIKDGVVVDFIN